MREFKKVTCAAYVTKELPSEEAARGRREAALRVNQSASRGSATNGTRAAGKREKTFNLSTYKLHALGDYPAAIKMFGTSDGYTSQVVSAHTLIVNHPFTMFRGKHNIKRSKPFIHALPNHNLRKVSPSYNVVNALFTRLLSRIERWW